MWIDIAARYLREVYCLTFEDVGIPPKEFEKRWRDQGETVQEAVDAFAQKYDLQPVFVCASIGRNTK